MLAAREAARPTVTYPDDLPVTQHREEIATAIADHQVVIVSGETGSGKTTQLPKICLDLGYGVNATIGHTQPRRLAARTVAARIAEELGTTVGQTVGFQVRFTDQVSDTTLVKVMTDGILLNEIQRDPLLRRYEVIIVDEAHERSLNIDFLLGYLKQLLPKRPDLKVIITSATIDSEKFASHFGTESRPAPVIEVSGRTYPVEIRYRPIVDDDADQASSICSAVDELMAAGNGDVLVFCAGERDIRDADDALAKHLGSRYVKPGE
ncbi:MAG TPA: DEAD/DEAH box helicase, partial [Beutenbergiaceae bacterium]|nr:DEAD/DEAH box helicase [Beutenbergiaceae bacterium]